MVATRLKYELPTGTHYLDLSRDLSEYHRKLHRQKKIYTVYGGFIRSNQGCSAKFNVAPLTWTAKAAVNRGFKIWRRMVSETLKNHDGLRSGKWNDFKVRLTNVVTSADYKSAVDAAGQPMSAGEWNYSTLSQPRLVDNDGDDELGFDIDMDQFDLHIVGGNNGAAPNYTSVGLINSWYESRPVIDSSGEPTNIPVTEDPLSLLFNVEDDDSEKVEIIQQEGDQPPYNRDAPYGMIGAGTGQQGLAPVAIADNDAANQVTALGSQVVGFQALCGLVQVVVNTSGTCELYIDVESEGESF